MAEKILKGMLRVGMGLRSVSGTYQLTEGTGLPGFLPRPEHFGTSPGNNWAPGFGFAMGLQPPDDLSENDVRVQAARNGWLTTSPYQNNPFTRTRSESMNLRAQVEPWQDLRIDITATLSDAENMNSFWRFDENLDNFTEQNKNVTRNYNISFSPSPRPGTVPCTFVQLKVFQQFLNAEWRSPEDWRRIGQRATRTTRPRSSVPPIRPITNMTVIH